MSYQSVSQSVSNCRHNSLLIIRQRSDNAPAPRVVPTKSITRSQHVVAEATLRWLGPDPGMSVAGTHLSVGLGYDARGKDAVRRLVRSGQDERRCRRGRADLGESSQASPQMPHFPPFLSCCTPKPPQYSALSSSFLEDVRCQEGRLMMMMSTLGVGNPTLHMEALEGGSIILTVEMRTAIWRCEVTCRAAGCWSGGGRGTAASAEGWRRGSWWPWSVRQSRFPSLLTGWILTGGGCGAHWAPTLQSQWTPH